MEKNLIKRWYKMLYGYNGKFIEVDLSNEKITIEKIDEQILREYIGGRALASKILWDRLGNKWEEVDPLGPENLLLFLTGPLTGYFPGARICVSGKSPQSNGIVGSTVAGNFAIELRCAGYDGIIVSGEAKKPVYLFVKDDFIEIKDASHIWGKKGKETTEILIKETFKELSNKWPWKGSWKDPGILYIGPAGENKSRIAAVMSKWSHAAGYGGYGGVMGSKKLKSIVVKGSNHLPPVANKEKVLSLIAEVCRVSIQEKDDWRRWGTGYGGYGVGADTSSEPIRNWQEEWHDNKSFGVDKFEERVWIKRYWGDDGCPTTCLKLAVIKDGEFKGTITDNPDYELQAYLGTNLGIFTPEGNAYMSSVIDDLGICGIQGGNVLGFAAELYQRGILTKKDLGIELEWGNPKAFAKLAEKIAYRKGIGNILAEGTYRAALKLSKKKKIDLMKYAVQSKGIAIGAHGIRSGLDYPPIIGYACSVQGGDHTSVAGLIREELWKCEMSMLFADSGVVCAFNVFKLDWLWDFLEAVTGWNITKEEWYDKIAARVLAIQRTFLLLGGPDIYWNPKTHDENPERFYEPLPSGPKKGKATDKEDFNKTKSEYYKTLGWDEYGIPSSEKLIELGLKDVDNILQKIRNKIYPS
jgi:aldehyde:ferredoxin oxidoreductase